MPVFEIEDIETGIKVLAEGDGDDPTQEEAKALVGEEIEFLKNNLRKGPGNRYLLDVGPLSEKRRFSESVDELMNKNQIANIKTEKIKEEAVDGINAIETAKKLVLEKIASGWSGDSVSELRAIYTNQFNILREKRNRQPEKVFLPIKGSTERTIEQLPENSFMLISHGAEEGGLYAEEGGRFTLNNVAKILGANSNNVHNIINLACYGGGKCKPEEYQSAFPNATNLVTSSPLSPNTISIDNIRKQRWFTDDSGTNEVPGIILEKRGETWQAMEKSSLFKNVTVTKPIKK